MLIPYGTELIRDVDGSLKKDGNRFELRRTASRLPSFDRSARTIADDNPLQGSGAFFALKTQKASSAKQLAEFGREAERLTELKGCPFIAQIVDHSVTDGGFFVILMELGACDLQFFLRKSLADLSLPGVARIFHSLVRAVDAAHDRNIIHRDIKPQNFLLVPMTPYADRVLATTTVPRENFEFRVVDEQDDIELEAGNNTSADRPPRPDVTLHIRDPSTGKEEVLPLRVKLSDFGMAATLEAQQTGDASQTHLSVKGCCGTILYMAPETFRPTKRDGTKYLSKDVDVWALGVILFQMLHDNRTPFGSYFRADAHIGVAVAASNPDIHKEVVTPERTRIWLKERTKLLLPAKRNGAARGAVEHATRRDEEAPIAHALLGAWLQTEFLCRMCEFCLAFEASERSIARDLCRWTEVASERNFWKGEILGSGEGARYAGPIQEHKALSIVGRIIVEGALPEVFRRTNVTSTQVRGK